MKDGGDDDDDVVPDSGAVDLELMPRVRRSKRIRVEIDEGPGIAEGDEEAEPVDANVVAIGGDGVTDFVQQPAHEQGEEVIPGLIPRQVDAGKYRRQQSIG